MKAQALEADKERLWPRLGIKQLEPTSIDEYIAEHKADADTVSGRIVEASGQRAKIELGERSGRTCKDARSGRPRNPPQVHQKA